MVCGLSMGVAHCCITTVNSVTHTYLMLCSSSIILGSKRTNKDSSAWQPSVLALHALEHTCRRGGGMVMDSDRRGIKTNNHPTFITQTYTHKVSYIHIMPPINGTSHLECDLGGQIFDG